MATFPIRSPVHKRFRLSDVIITPRDIWALVRHLFSRRGQRDLFGLILLLVWTAELGYGLHASPEVVFFWGFVLVLVYWRQDGRFALACALACLVMTPVFLELGQGGWLLYGKKWAEQTAVWTYYFLCIGVGKQIFDMLLERHRESVTTPKPVDDGNSIQANMNAMSALLDEPTEVQWVSPHASESAVEMITEVRSLPNQPPLTQSKREISSVRLVKPTKRLAFRTGVSTKPTAAVVKKNVKKK